jgi:galactitol-specific phosphotransferase system IIC component
MKKNNKQELQEQTGKSIAIGVVGGTLVGVLTDNIGLWLPLGIAFGAGSELFTQMLKKKINP